MADLTITQLPADATLTGAEEVPIMDGGITKKTTVQDIANLAAGGVSSVNGETGIVVLDATDVGADAAGTASGLLAAHVAAADPHPGYLTPAEGNAAYAPIAHSNIVDGNPHGTNWDQIESTATKIPFNTGLAAQTLSAGEIAWNPDERTFDMGVNGVTLQAGQEIIINVRNNTLATIPNGTVCMATGTIGASGRITIAPMDGTNPANAMYLLGIATEDIAAGADGFVTVFGKVRGLNTSAWSEGDVLYTSTTTAGALTNVAPTTGLKQPIAIVINAAVNGTLFVRIETIDNNKFEPKGTIVTTGDGSKYLANDGTYKTATSGASDHGSLTGLADDDHTQYLNETRHDLLDHTGLIGIPAPYALPTASTTVLGGVKVDGTSITITDGVISAVGGGSGDVVGPASAVSNNVAVFDGITGKLIKDSGVAVHDPVTVADSTSIDLTLTGQQISAAAIFGTTSGTVAEGNHTHTGVYQPADTQLTDLAALSYSGNANKVVSVKATEDGFELVTSGSSVSDAAYDASSWDGVTTVAPSKNAVRDKIETLISQGKHTIWIPATAMIPRTTNGAAAGTVETSTNKVMLRTLDFDSTTAEYAQFQIQMPKSWNEGTVTAAFVWSHAITTTNFGVAWSLQGVALSNDDAADTAFGTKQTITDTGGTTDDIYVTSETSAITIGNTPAAQDWVVFQIERTVANAGDTMAIDARLHGIQLFYTIDGATDA